MKFSIIRKRKKKGYYYIITSVDSYGFKRIWGRYKTLSKARKKKRGFESRFG